MFYKIVPWCRVSESPELFHQFAASNQEEKNLNISSGKNNCHTLFTPQAESGMKQPALKSVKNYLNTSIYTYLEASGDQNSDLY
jgi:hypothetical protein